MSSAMRCYNNDIREGYFPPSVLVLHTIMKVLIKKENGGSKDAAIEVSFLLLLVNACKLVENAHRNKKVDRLHFLEEASCYFVVTFMYACNQEHL